MQRLGAACPTLVRLNVAGTGAADTHAAHVAAAGRCLEALDVSDNADVGSRGVEALARGCARLASVNFNGCEKVAEGALVAFVSHLGGAVQDLCQLPGARVAQSSTTKGAGAQGAVRTPAVEADRSQDLVHGSVTAVQVEPWWEIDLGDVCTVGALTIAHGLRDQPGVRRMTLHVVFTTERLTQPSLDAAARRPPGTCVHHVVPSADLTAGLTVMSLDVPVRARYVRFVLCQAAAFEPNRRAERRRRAEACRLVLHAVQLFRKCLRHVDFGGTGAGDVALDALSSTFPLLRSAKLSRCMVSDAAVMRAAAHCANLRVLDLRATPAATPQATQALATSCPLLVELRLGAWASHRSRAAGAAPFFAAATAATATTRGMNGAGGTATQDSGVAALHTSLSRWGLVDSALQLLARGCQRLQILDVSGHDRLTAAGIASLAALPALRLLDATHVPGATDAALAAVAAARLDLRVVDDDTMRGVATGDQVAVCAAHADTFKRQQVADWRAAVEVQRWWRRRRAHFIMQVHMGLSDHKRMGRILRTVPMASSPAERGAFLSMGWAAHVIGRAYRASRFRHWSRAASVVQRGWRCSKWREVETRRIWRVTVRWAAVSIQKTGRGHLGRVRAAVRRRAACVISRSLKHARHMTLCRWWRRWYALRRRNAGRVIWRRFRARVMELVRARKAGRMLVLAMLFWMINVNLRYLWGKSMLDHRENIRRINAAATTIQRAWIFHVIRGSQQHGWAFVDTALKQRETKRVDAVQLLQGFVRRNRLRRLCLKRAATLTVSAGAAQHIQRHWRGRSGRLDAEQQRVTRLAEEAEAYGNTVGGYLLRLRVRRSGGQHRAVFVRVKRRRGCGTCAVFSVAHACFLCGLCDVRTRSLAFNGGWCVQSSGCGCAPWLVLRVGGGGVCCADARGSPTAWRCDTASKSRTSDGVVTRPRHLRPTRPTRNGTPTHMRWAWVILCGAGTRGASARTVRWSPTWTGRRGWSGGKALQSKLVGTPCGSPGTASWTHKCNGHGCWCPGAAWCATSSRRPCTRRPACGGRRPRCKSAQRRTPAWSACGFKKRCGMRRQTSMRGPPRGR